MFKLQSHLKSVFRFLAMNCLIGLIGCSSGTPDYALPMEAPKYNPDEISDRAIKQLDKNGNGLIDINELENSPAVKRMAGKTPKSVSRDDLKKRFESYVKAGQEAVIGVSLRLFMNDNPLEGATVTLVPEAFMGPEFRPATCTTDSEGFGSFKVDGSQKAGVPSGFYKITVSKKDASGNETIPARFNTQTKEGREIFDDGRTGSSTIELHIRS